MRKISKVLSVLLAMVLLFSTVSIGVEAAYNAYKDNAITRYDAIDKPVLTPDQYASMAMDEVDRMLAEENIVINYDLAGLVTIKADFSSIDNSLKSISDLYKDIKSLLSTIRGDIEQLKWDALVNKSTGELTCPLRGTSGKTDGDIFLALLKFLSDNANIIRKVPYGATENGGLDLGLLGGFVNLGDKLDVVKIAKEALAKLVWPDTPKNQLNTNLTVDEYVETFIDLVVSGNYSKKNALINRISSLIQTYIPGINEQIDLLNDSVYTIIDKGLKIALNDVGVPFANPRLKAALRRLCGYSYKKTKDSDGDTIWVPDPSEPDELNGLENVVNVNFSLSKFPIESWGDDLLVTHLNDILGQIVRAAIHPDIKYTWKTAGGNANLLENIITVAKKILENTGDTFFASYVEVLTPTQLEALSDDQFVAYILRSILNGSIDDVFIPSSCDSTMEVLVELVKSLAATAVPSRDYANLPNDLNSLKRMGLDMAAAGLNGITNMQLEYDLEEDDFAEICMNWVTTNYGGFVSEIDGDDAWEKLSYILFQIIPSDWLPDRANGNPRDNIYDIIFTDIVDNILAFNLEGVLELIDVNPNGELNGTLIEVLLARITGIINYIFGEVFPYSADYSHLDNLLQPDLLSQIIYNLLTCLYSRASSGLMDALLPVLCSVLDLSTAEEFGYPYISLEDQHSASMTTLQSFYMYNGSKGINTNATDKYGVKTQDKLYNYYIQSVVTNNDDITVSPSGGFYIPGGESKTFTFNGDMSAAEDSVLKVTITYKVYGEKGNTVPITQQALTATTYTYIYDSSTITDDTEKAKADTIPKDNTHLVYYKPATYLSVDSTLGDLADYSVDMQRNAVKDSSTHTKSAVFEVTNVVLNPTLRNAGVTPNSNFSITTTPRGGVTEYKPYTVSNPSATIPEGNYENQIYFHAQATQGTVEENIPIVHNVFVYDDFGLPKLLSNAVRADRQQANYGTGIYEAEYPEFGSDPDDENPEMVSETVNGSEAWTRYEEAVSAAAAIVYAPKQVSMMQTFVNNGDFESAARELYAATQELEACSVSSGTAGIKAALDSVVPPDVDYVDEDGNEIRYEYDDVRHTYFARADYISYTYGNFKAERKAAQKVIDQEKEAQKEGKDFQIEAVRAAYLAHRVSLYGERLVRVKAYKTHLNRAINAYTPLKNAGQGTWSSDSWNEFTRAYNFAVTVNTESVGSTIGNTENLQNDNALRQSKVNEARSQLIRARKRLVEAKLLDCTQLSAKIADVKATYDAGIGNYTQLSWNTFKAAYDAAVQLVALELEDTAENQQRVASALTALTNAFAALEENSVEEGDWFFNDGDFTTMVSSEMGMSYLVGLYDFYPNVSDFVETLGGYNVVVDANDKGCESTGALVTVYDADGGFVGEFYVVLYGDCNGDEVIEGLDVGDMLDAATGMGIVEWEPIVFTDENANAMAADTDHNGMLDGNDASIILEIANGRMYNQAWATFGDPLFLDD